jgi:acetyl-CoA decarbonylase/synthase complex subunit gamma
MTGMALKALDIYKMLPKKNCKECGDPTCLTFAMKLAAGKGDVSLCPYLDDGAKSALGASTRPPIRLVTIGTGERSFAVGEETVLYRHDKTFYHPPGILFRVEDTLPEEAITSVVRRVKNERLTRVGTDLFINGIAVKNASNSVDRFAETVAVVEKTADLPLVLISDNPAAQAAALAHCGTYRPLIHAAGVKNAGEMCSLARKHGCPLAVRADNLSDLSKLVSACNQDGVQDLVLDPGTVSAAEYIEVGTGIRQMAITRSVPEMGYPVYLDATMYPLEESAIVLGIVKYASVIITSPLSPESVKAALTLRQNIFTDPQKPIQMNPGIYRIGNPQKDSPVFLTVNFSLTYFTLAGYLEATGMPCFLMLVDTEGLSVLTAVASGKLNENLVKNAIVKYNLENEVSHKKIIIPGYASPLSGRIEDLTGWNVLVGPRDAAEVGEYLEQVWKKEPRTS